jgi:hypothetical protein
MHSRASFGVDFEAMRRPVRTLKSLCRQAALTSVDFLKIDAEGAERDVIAGMDFNSPRPRVLLIEAEVPGTMPEAWRDWEIPLLEQGYALAFQDTLNRWYVAEEEMALRARFPNKPADWHSLEHLWHCGRAVEKPEHPDHALAVILQRGFFASLPSIDSSLLTALIEQGLRASKSQVHATVSTVAELLGTAEFPRPRMAHGDLPSLLATDEFRAALGRIACAYDGGHIME